MLPSLNSNINNNNQHELISMFTEEELEAMFCGEAEVDLSILR